MKSLVLCIALFLTVIAPCPWDPPFAAPQDSGRPDNPVSTPQSEAGSQTDSEDQGSATAKTAPAAFSPEALSLKEKISRELLQETFTYDPKQLNDPFVSFIKPPEPPPPQLPPEDETLPPELQKPLTPLQKMNIGEIEKGLRAIVWGGLGRKAIIQDAAGKGYIVSVGTPAGGPTGVIVQIFDDRLVIQRQLWDGKLKRMVLRNDVVKLRKGKEIEG
ncbi:hypothetical protein [Desulfoferrobacter suflitae]|uniref:hypothetical protein n=1 Tax=Desulfoferrobacter suflitae TaxID=2865782 RepID=UPI0021640300|nr:hypothetical protein [Desulfoferrobacter suflitae]MCK8600215.1 hypothetical protein [Desulfoferrobacter suflitae]